MTSSVVAAHHIAQLREHLPGTTTLDGLDKVQFFPVRQTDATLGQKILLGTWGRSQVYALLSHTFGTTKDGERLRILGQDETSQIRIGWPRWKHIALVEPFSHLLPALATELEDRDVQRSVFRYLEACFIMKGLAFSTKEKIERICRWANYSIACIRTAQNTEIATEADRKIFNATKTRGGLPNALVQRSLTFTANGSSEVSSRGRSYNPTQERFIVQKDLFTEAVPARVMLGRARRAQILFKVETLKYRYNRGTENLLEFEVDVSGCEREVYYDGKEMMKRCQKLGEYQRKFDELEHIVNEIQQELEQCSNEIIRL